MVRFDFIVDEDLNVYLMEVGPFGLRSQLKIIEGYNL